MNKSTEIFESYRPGLFSLAYGMLGRIALAEDAVQEAYIRWQQQNIEQIRSNKAYLTKIVNNICLDEIKSAKNRREQYIGPNLPEPFLAAEYETPETETELAESLSMALFMVLDQLNPVQRAVFILREVFDYDYASVSEIINKSESNCRKIAQRARESMQKQNPKFEKKPKKQHELVKVFIKAVREGDVQDIESKLAKEATLYSDGGGKVAAARKPIFGAVKIAKFFKGIQKGLTETIRIAFTDVNSEPGLILYLDEKLYGVWSFHIENDEIQGIYAVLNPDKLKRLKQTVGKNSVQVDKNYSYASLYSCSQWLDYMIYT